MRGVCRNRLQQVTVFAVSSLQFLGICSSSHSLFLECSWRLAYQVLIGVSTKLTLRFHLQNVPLKCAKSAQIFTGVITLMECSSEWCYLPYSWSNADSEPSSRLWLLSHPRSILQQSILLPSKWGWGRLMDWLNRTASGIEGWLSVTNHSQDNPKKFWWLACCCVHRLRFFLFKAWTHTDNHRNDHLLHSPSLHSEGRWQLCASVFSGSGLSYLMGKITLEFHLFFISNAIRTLSNINQKWQTPTKL